MKIHRVRFWKEDLDLVRPYTIAYKTVSAVENVFVLLETESGLQGIGAGSPAAFVTNETIEQSVQLLDKYLEELTLGRDVRHYQEIIRDSREKMPASPAARAALDIALHDLFTKFLEIPLVDYFGRFRKSLPTSVTIGINDIEKTLEEADEHIHNGFRIIKLKTGHAVDVDIEIFRKLREQLGRHVKIRVDANQGYTTSDLEQFVAATSDYGLEFVEQPLPKGEFRELLSLPWEIRRQCVADEDMQLPVDAVRLAKDPLPYGIYNIKLMKCGGIAAGKSIADIAYDRGIDLMWGCMDESVISIAAALHIALACPATRYLDLDGSLDLARDLATGGFRLEQGHLYPLNRPGLGVQLHAKIKQQ